jgi:flagellin-like protein
VSPVIAVILMVAITVVLAATVYVWVSGFSATGQQAKNLAVTQVANVGSVPVQFNVISISSNFACTALKVTDTPAAGNPGSGPYLGSTAAGANNYYLLDNGAACSSTAMGPGDTISMYWGSAGALNAPKTGDVLNFIDTGSNNVVATLTVR